MNSTEKNRRKISKVRIISVEQAESLEPHIFEQFSKNAQEGNSVSDLSSDQVPMSAEMLEKAEQARRAEEEIQADIQESYDRGFSDGQAVTSSLMEAEMSRLRESTKNLDTMILELREQFAREVEKLEVIAVQVAISCAEHILEREVSINTRVAVEQAKKVLSNMHGLRDVTIRVHPDSYEAMKEANNELLNATSSLRKVEILADNSIENGACLLETTMGSIDTQLRSQLLHLRESMEETVNVKELAGEF